MRILHLSQYYPPEFGAVQVRAEKMATTWAQRGHDVTVIAELPNHPQGIIWPDYRGTLWQRRRDDGVDVVRIWVKTARVKNFYSRMAFYLSYMLGAITAGLFLGKYDVIFANSPPLFVAVAGAVLGWLKRTPFVMEVQDLWPQSAVEMGELRSKRAQRLGTWLEEFCYRRATVVSAVSRGIEEDLRRRLPAEKLRFIPNGTNTDIFYPKPEMRDPMRTQLGLTEKFIVMYGGILGVAQGLEVVLDTAKLLADHPDIFFLIIGEGPRKEALMARHADLQLTNLRFVPGQPIEKMADYLAASDVALVPLRPLAVFAGVLPTKMFDAWACARPTIVSVGGEARALVEQSQAGIYVEPGNPRAIADAIVHLRNNRAELARLGQQAHAFVHQTYTLQAAAGAMEEVLRAASAWQSGSSRITQR